jgi:hypothetical protein
MLFFSLVALADEPKQKTEKKIDAEAKELSGMSIVGNDEAPKSLYIVPWKSSQLGVETTLDSMLNERDRPVDREVFKRQIEFYRITRTAEATKTTETTEITKTTGNMTK